MRTSGTPRGGRRSRPSRIRAVALLVALTLCTHPSETKAGLITLSPPLPTSQDSIHVDVHEGFPMGHCWQVVSRTCTTSAPDSILITADIQFCMGNPGCPCTMSAVTFHVTCDFPPLPPGNYRAVYQERYLNPVDTRNVTPSMLLFTVSGTTPTLRKSWGRLKTIYR